jgi:hypothetical protein
MHLEHDTPGVSCFKNASLEIDLDIKRAYAGIELG